MSEDKSYQGKQALVEWSKWITGISLFSASGCVGVLVSKGVGEKNIINIKLAIVFFLISIVVAWLIQLTIAMEAPAGGRAEIDVRERSSDAIQKEPVVQTSPAQLVLRSLIVLEILMFLLSCFFLARWVWKFPAAKPVSETSIKNDIELNPGRVTSH